MNQERLMMEGQLAALTQEQEGLRIKGQGYCNQISQAVNQYLHEVDDMPVSAAAAFMDELVMAQAELIGINGKIKALEEALGK